MDYTNLELRLNTLINQQVEKIQTEIKSNNDLPNHLIPSSRLYVNKEEGLLLIEIKTKKGIKLDITTLKYYQPFIKIAGNCLSKVSEIELGLPDLDQHSLVPKFYQQENRQFELTITLPHHFGELPTDIHYIHAKFVVPNLLKIYIPIV